MRGFRGQVNLLVATTMSLVLVAFLIPLGLLLRREAEQRAIADATLRAQSTAALLAVSPATAVSAMDPDGTLLTVFLGGRRTGAVAARTPSAELAARGNAFAASTTGGVEVLVPVQSSHQATTVVRIFVPDRVLHAGVRGCCWEC
jgi:hypothetical protein